MSAAAACGRSATRRGQSGAYRASAADWTERALELEPLPPCTAGFWFGGRNPSKNAIWFTRLNQTRTSSVAGAAQARPFSMSAFSSPGAGEPRQG